MGRRATRTLAAWCALAAGAVACNGLSGVGDLKEVDTLDAGHLPDATVTPPDAAPDAATATDAQVPRPDGAELDAADAACAPLPAPLFLGAARALQGAYEITTPVVGIGGAVVWPLPQALDHFDASFEFVIGTSSGVTPAAGLVFFLSSAAGKGLGCSPGPNLCVLGNTLPGYGVVLRTSKGRAADPSVPYVAVVDATSYPSAGPTTPVDVDAAAVETDIAFGGGGNQGLPTTGWHTMAIHLAKGLVDVAIDGQAIVTAAPVPVQGPIVGSWGIAGATGAASGAELLAVRNITLHPCP